jgi:glycosyltransferase involved in cell wall biosynthesis
MRIVDKRRFLSEGLPIIDVPSVESTVIEAPVKISKIWLNAIVKNEAAVIKRCLDSVKPFIDGWAIVDTGSTDGTQTIIQNELNGLPGELIETEFKDFATSRNTALKTVMKYASPDDYLLLLDGDEEIKQDEGVVLPKLIHGCYESLIRLGSLEYWRILLVKAGLPWKWFGACHEVIECSVPFTKGRLQGIWRQAYSKPSLSPKEKKEKFLWHASLLKSQLERDTGNTRTRFYLAQSLRDAGELEEAVNHYLHRSLMGGFAEEVYLSLLNVARLYEKMDKPIGDVIAAYLKAAGNRPSRAEALGSLLSYLRKKGLFYEASVIGREAIQLKPTNDMLFVEHDWERWRILDEIAISSFWAKRFEQAKAASEELMIRPFPAEHKERIEKNHKFILDSLGHK